MALKTFEHNKRLTKSAPVPVPYRSVTVKNPGETTRDPSHVTVNTHIWLASHPHISSSYPHTSHFRCRRVGFWSPTHGSNSSSKRSLGTAPPDPPQDRLPSRHQGTIKLSGHQNQLPFRSSSDDCLTGKSSPTAVICFSPLPYKECSTPISRSYCYPRDGTYRTYLKACQVGPTRDSMMANRRESRCQHL